MATRPLQSPYCPLCADNHRLLVVQDATDAFSLCNLLPAGTIIVAVHDGESHCPNASNNREWHSLPLKKLSTHPEDTLFRRLAFLTQRLFLRATCRLGASGHIIFIRIYLIPNDLPNVCGRLQRRPDAVVKEARRHMHNVVPLIEQGCGLWDADESCLNAPQKHFLPSHIDNRTMAEIYTDLPSPVLNSSSEDSSASRRIASGGTIWGLRTTLYGYQRHSVAVMLEKESNPKPVPDPLCIPVSCMSGVRWYIQPSTMSLLRECPMFSPSQGGILCEELGTGKTVMIIALVLATANEIPQPEESPVDARPVLTPLAYNHFPSTEHALARNRAGFGWRAIRQVPSLVELLVHYFSLLRLTSGRPTYADELEASHLWPFIQANAPFYHHYDSELRVEESQRSRRRNAPNQSPRTMYLSSATLVIVPLALVGQWKTEIDKHCHDHVRYLIVRRSTVLPHAKKLASDYELIVMSDTCFRKEAESNKTERLYDLMPCKCAYLEGSRVPNCHCPRDPDVTPLLQVRWKRLAIDEGHTASNVAATLNCFVRQLSIQHKWIVTGTPTSNILGLQLGRTTDEHESDHNADSVEFIPSFPHSSPMPMSPDLGDEAQVQIWGSYDSVNLRKLRTMIGDFLAVPRFHSDLDIFTDHVSTQLCNQHGPRPGAISVLTQVMQMVMVRHRIEDVENDILIPPMKHDIVYMDLDHYAVKSYNAMQAALAINAIDSERTGSDYLFHPSKAKELQAAIGNSLQGLFWSSSDILYNVDQICDYADEYLAIAIRRGKEPEELNLLQQALKHAAIAANDQIWRAMQPHPDVPFVLSGLDPDIFEAWTRTGLRSANRTIDVMHPDRLVNLRSLVRRTPLISVDELIEEGNILDNQEKMNVAPKALSSRRAGKATNKTKQMAREVQGTIEVLKRHIERMEVSDDDEFEQCQGKDRVNQIGEEASVSMTRYSPLSGVKVGPSLSTKLNYILSEVRRHSVEEKFLIFSNSLLTLSQVSEALSLFDVKYLRFTKEEQYLLREQCIMTFETSDVYRVLLIDLKLGARGLNLISASRIIFCEPVWHPDVESQAIKRVHRIGQTRPVTVKTLVIRSTAEEAMITRKQYLRTGDKIPNMTTESGMRQYLQNPRFLGKPTSSDLPSVVLSLDNNRGTSVGIGDEGGASRVDVDVCGSGGEPSRKKVHSTRVCLGTVNFACHGIPNQEQPFESAFGLHDGGFTIQHIIQCDLQNPEFAYLSACHTTVGDQENPDEVIHLASAKQFAGFRSVIGTMWAVDDAETRLKQNLERGMGLESTVGCMDGFLGKRAGYGARTHASYLDAIVMQRGQRVTGHVTDAPVATRLFELPTSLSLSRPARSMLAIITPSGTSLIDPASLKSASSSFPISNSLECSASIWSPDNSQLYLSKSSSIKRYTPTECLLEDLYYGSDTVTCMEMKDNSNTLFFAAANKVWLLDCTRSPGRVISSLEPHKHIVTRISMSSDGTLLASVSSSAVFVHNLTLSSHTQLKGLPDRKPITCCLFHQHSRTKLLLGVGHDLVVYDSMRPSSPLKSVRIPGNGDVVGVATSPFSKTLVAVVTSNGDVVLVDLDKDNGILKAVNVKTPLTCCAFTAEGAAIYLGTQSGKLLILDLRSLEKEPKSFAIGDGGTSIKAIDVKGKSKSYLNETASRKAKSSSAAAEKLSPRRSRTVSTNSIFVGVKSPARATVMSKIRGGGGVTPKKKLFSPARAPLSETQNLGLDAHLSASRSPTLSRHTKPLRFQKSEEHRENCEAPVSLESTKLASARQRTLSHKMQDVGHVGLGSVPESISGHLAVMRVRSGSIHGPGEEANRTNTTTRRVVSESVASASDGRKHRSTSSVSARSKATSGTVNGAARQQKQERGSTTPDNTDDHLDLSSPELPCEPVTPISLGKNATKAPLLSATSSGVGMLGPEVVKRPQGESRKEKEKEKAVEVKKTRFAQYVDTKVSSGGSDKSEDDGDAEALVDERQDGGRDQDRSLQVSPRRPTATPTWLQSPHRPSAAGLNMNTTAQDFLRGIVHDVMYDFQRETKAELMGLHLDLVRMGRGWKQELREIMEEWSGEIQELKAENKRLKEENERLRRGY